MDSGDLWTFLILLVLLPAPAIIVFAIAMVIRNRRAKIHRQRIKKSHRDSGRRPENKV